MPSCRIAKKLESQREPSSDSSLSSVPSLDEASKTFDVRETAVTEGSSPGRSSNRKRRAVALAKAAPVKRVKTTKATVSAEVPIGLNSSPSTTKGRKTKVTTKTEVEVNGHQSTVASSRTEESEAKPKLSGVKVKASKVSIQEEDQAIEKSTKSQQGAKSKKTARKREVGSDSEEGKEGKDKEKPDTKIRRARKTKEEKEAEAMPLMARTAGLRMYIGAHVSCAKGSTYFAICLWSIADVYISAVELSNIGINRRTECSHKCCAHRVGSISTSKEPHPYIPN